MKNLACTLRSPPLILFEKNLFVKHVFKPTSPVYSGPKSIILTLGLFPFMIQFFGPPILTTTASKRPPPSLSLERQKLHLQTEITSILTKVQYSLLNICKYKVTSCHCVPKYVERAVWLLAFRFVDKEDSQKTTDCNTDISFMYDQSVTVAFSLFKSSTAHLSIHPSLHISMYICVCVCVCVFLLSQAPLVITIIFLWQPVHFGTSIYHRQIGRKVDRYRQIERQIERER